MILQKSRCICPHDNKQQYPIDKTICTIVKLLIQAYSIRISILCLRKMRARTECAETSKNY